MPSPLREDQAALLAFEENWPVHSGSKEEAIRRQLHLSVVDYYMRLNLLVSTESALAHDPVLVGRLRRVLDQRRAARAQRTNENAL